MSIYILGIISIDQYISFDLPSLVSGILNHLHESIHSSKNFFARMITPEKYLPEQYCPNAIILEKYN